MRANRWVYTVFSLLVAVALAAGAWYGLRWLELVRADSMISTANGHIEDANRLMASAPIGSLGRDAFTSTGSIGLGVAAAGEAQPLLQEARAEAGRALDEVRRARGLFLLPEGYHTYLDIKERSALSRIEQLDNLLDTVSRLSELYGSGAVIFTTVEELDRLQGQFDAAEGRMLSSPAEAQAEMQQIAASMRSLKAPLDAAYAENGFELLSDLARSLEVNAELVDLTAELAGATAAGDQAAAQQAAAAVEEKLGDRELNIDHLDLWWSTRIIPLRRTYDELQSRQEALDADAAAAYAAAA